MRTMPIRRPPTGRWRLLPPCLALLAAVTAPAVAAAPARPAPAAAPAAAPVALAGDTTVVATRSGALDVVLRAPASLRIGPGPRSPDATVRGAGRMFGLALARRGGDGTVGEPLLLAVGYGPCGGPGCRPAAPYTQTSVVAVFGVAGTPPDGGISTYTLPAGRYALHMLVDGAPVTVRLRLHGLSGATRLGVRRVTAPTVRTVSGGVQPAGPLTYSAGEAARVPTPLGLLLNLNAYDVSPHAAHLAGTCFYLDARPPGEVNLPGCPRAAGGGPLGQVSSVWVRAVGVGYGWAVVRAPGTWYQGVFRHGVQGPGVRQTSLAWLPLD